MGGGKLRTGEVRCDGRDAVFSSCFVCLVVLEPPVAIVATCNLQLVAPDNPQALLMLASIRYRVRSVSSFRSGVMQLTVAPLSLLLFGSFWLYYLIPSVSSTTSVEVVLFAIVGLRRERKGLTWNPCFLLQPCRSSRSRSGSFNGNQHIESASTSRLRLSRCSRILFIPAAVVLVSHLISHFTALA